MIYFDSSAIMKLVRAETESAALADWIAQRGDESVVSSELARIEVLRAARRAGSAALAEAHAVVGDLDLVPMGDPVQRSACDIGDASLRTPDAIHLASAVLLRGELSAFVAYDRRLLDAAEQLALPCVSPGR